MEKLMAEIVSQRIMLAQLVAFVANQQADRELFVANFREASLRSLDKSIGGATDRLSNDTLLHAQSIISATCDSAGRAT